MMSFGMVTGAVLVPLGAAFMLFVAPLWLWLHYRRGSGDQAGTQRLAAEMSGLAAVAQRIEIRVATLERALLDAEPPFATKV